MKFKFKNNFQYIRSIIYLYKEAGGFYLKSFIFLYSIKNILEIMGLGLIATFLFNPKEGLPNAIIEFSILQAFCILFFLMFARGCIQIIIATSQEELRTSLLDKLRVDLFTKVLYSSSQNLGQVSRGELLGLLIVDINRSVIALEQSIRSITALLSIFIFSTCILFFSKFSAISLFLGLLSSFLAFYFRREDSWEIGQLQSKLNYSLQKTLGDGLFGL